MISVRISFIQRQPDSPIDKRLLRQVQNGCPQNGQNFVPEMCGPFVAPVLRSFHRTTQNLRSASLALLLLVGNEVPKMRQEFRQQCVFERFEEVLSVKNIISTVIFVESRLTLKRRYLYKLNWSFPFFSSKER